VGNWHPHGPDLIRLEKIFLTIGLALEFGPFPTFDRFRSRDNLMTTGRLETTGFNRAAGIAGRPMKPAGTWSPMALCGRTSL
jgi:hypothetical protein